ncbi:MAG: Ig domain-containing protein, partial [Collinsella sp.]|nr:Ig domain-containing protein [Collinsella sp.]
DTPSASEGGTTGQGRAVEAVRLRLTGSLAKDYDVYYRVHASNIGWMAWAKDGEEAGTTGFGRSVEAVQIRLVKKGDAAPSSDGANVDYAFKKKPMSLTYRAHVSNVGWQGAVSDGATAGTTGRGLALEDLKLSLDSSGHPLGLRGRHHRPGPRRRGRAPEAHGLPRQGLRCLLPRARLQHRLDGLGQGRRGGRHHRYVMLSRGCSD